ncbi:M48 family metalloprotease [Martelella mediterranea]|uniref:TPR repeat-containing protein YfgC n=1 Tax=Martelella mediterranea DSM 17316 TaxID=1122214 RepID=A0A1U9YXU3_9HYPH|nr:TPR repeat-containing protein YfgC precursor [Martelella mediterranea DSM 17316]
MVNKVGRGLTQDRRRRFLPGVRPSVFVLIAALGLASCQTNDTFFILPETPASAEQTVDALTRNDPNAAMGAREHPRILETYGGQYRDPQVEKLVARVAGALTAVSENPRQTYRITILNSPSINAFALPGGYLYVTRGLLALATDASEIAAVLSHEMAHVTANHGIERQRREEAEAISNEVISEVLPGNPEVDQIAARGKMRLAAFSRQQELEADAIGIRMLAEAGYDPYAASRFLRSMAAYAQYESAGAEGESLDFLSSHPNTPRRVELAAQQAALYANVGPSEIGRDYFLNGINGLLYGSNPEQGYIRNRDFYHPKLQIAFQVPPGFVMTDKANAVVATGPGDVAIRFDGVKANGRRDLEEYIRSGWVTGLVEGSVQSTTVNGMPAATAKAVAGDWVFDVTVIRDGGDIYRLLTAAPRGSGALEDTAFSVRSSFRKLSPAEAADLKPLRIRIVTVQPGDTVASLAAKMMGTNRKLALFQVLNALPPGATLSAGETVKIVSQ